MSQFFLILFNNLKLLRITDVIDIAVVAFVIYHGIKLIRETRASQLIKGIIVLVLIMYVSEVLKLNSINFILENTLQIGLIAVLIIFQPELRRTLEKVGNASVRKLIKINDDTEETYTDEICSAVSKLASSKTGALILIERSTKLGDIIASGTEIDAKVSQSLLVNLFVPNTPLHDGAVIIGGNRIKAAACLLPLTQNTNFSKELGTRHRAAIGVSEVADCIAIVVSEETGTISMAINGRIKRDHTPVSLRRDIDKILESDKGADNPRSKKDKIFPRAVRKK